MGIVKYWEVGKINISNNLIYAFDFLANAAFIGLIIFVFTQLWTVVYGGNVLIEGFTLPMMIWYLVLTEAIVVSPGRVIEEIGEEIQSGTITNNLNKPYNYLIFKYASTMGSTLLRFGLTIVIGSLVAWVFVGGFEVYWPGLIVVGIGAVLALTLHYCMMAFLGVFAFWLEDAKSLHFLYQKTVFVLGGMLLPLEIFPSWLEHLASWLPFSYVAYHPARLLVRFDWVRGLEVLAYQLLWIGGIVILVSVLYKVLIRKLSINGG